MIIRVECDFEKLVKAYERDAMLTRSCVSQVVKIITRDIADYAASHHQYVSRSGNMERSGITTAMTDELTGVVALNIKAVPYASYLHNGTRAHDVAPRQRKVLRWVDGGEFVFAKRSHVGGITADPFLFDAAAAVEPRIAGIIDSALDKVFR